MPTSLLRRAALGASMLSCAALPAAAQESSTLFRVEGIEIQLPAGFRPPTQLPGRDSARIYLAFTQDGQGQLQLRVQDLPGSEGTTELERRRLLAETVGYFAGAVPAAMEGGRVIAVDSSGPSTAEYLSGTTDYEITLRGARQRVHMRLFIPRTGLVRLIGLTLRLPGEADPLAREDVARLFSTVRIPVPSGPGRVQGVGDEGFELTLPAGFGDVRRREGNDPERFYHASNGEVVVVIMVVDPRRQPRDPGLEARGRYLQGEARRLGRALPGPELPGFLTAEVQLGRDGSRRLSRAYVPRAGPMKFIQLFVRWSDESTSAAADPAWSRILDTLQPAGAAGPAAAAPRPVPR